MFKHTEVHVIYIIYYLFVCPGMTLKGLVRSRLVLLVHRLSIVDINCFHDNYLFVPKHKDMKESNKQEATDNLINSEYGE